MKIYTKTGDDGSTSLWGGKRVAKDALRIQAYGTVDECNATLGLVRSALQGIEKSSELDVVLAQIQNQLFVLGGDLATETPTDSVPQIQSKDVLALEKAIDQFEAELSPLTQFILARRAYCRRLFASGPYGVSPG